MYPVPNYISGLNEYLVQSLYFFDIETSYKKDKDLDKSVINYL